MDVYHLYFDTPSEKDSLHREKYASVLIEKIICSFNQKDNTNFDTNGAFTILINECYGFGKTTFLKLIEKDAKSRQIDVAWFKPWLYSDTKTLIENLFTIIADNGIDNISALRSNLFGYLKLIASTKDINITSFNHKSAEERYCDIENTLRKRRAPLLILIDDVDRLQSQELFNLLQLIRNTANFSNIYYIIAGDKERIGDVIHNAGIEESDEYLKKFFCFELNLPKDDGYKERILTDELKVLFDKVGISSEEAGKGIRYIKSLEFVDVILPTVRDVYRFLNNLSYGLDIIKSNGLMQDISLNDFLGLSIIKYSFGSLYKILRDNDAYIFQQTSNNRLTLKDDYVSLLNSINQAPLLKNIWSKVQQSDATNNKNDSQDKQHNYEEFIHSIKPSAIEVSGKILQTLFPTNSYSETNRINYKLEYFKYFSLDCQSNEIMQVEVSDVMQIENLDEFKEKVSEILMSNKIESFLHKINWFVKYKLYNRLSILQKILVTNEIENIPQNRLPGTNELAHFQMYYYSLIQQIYISRPINNDVDSLKELQDWFRSTQEYKYAALTLLALHESFQRGNNIFTTDEFVQMCDTAFKSFVKKKFVKDFDDEENCLILEMYKENLSSFCSVGESLYEIVHRFRNPLIFLFYCLHYQNDKLSWNISFVRVVMSYFYQIENAKFFDVDIPKEWMPDLQKNILDKDPNDLINDSHPFIKTAYNWWKNVRGVSSYIS